MHYRWNATRFFGRRFGQTLRLEISRLHPRHRPELCVTPTQTMTSSKSLSVKYIALLAMVKIVPSHPYLVAEYQDTILASVNDPDISIRMRALDLVTAMVRPKMKIPVTYSRILAGQ